MTNGKLVEVDENENDRVEYEKQAASSGERPSSRPQSANSKKAKPWRLCDHGVNLRLKKLSQMYNNARYSDVILTPVEEEGQAPKKFHAHKAHLSAWSKSFDAMFFGPDAHNIANSVLERASVEVNCSAITLELFLRFIYEGEMTIHLDELWPFYCFLTTYQIDDIIHKVEDIMDRAVNVDNCCSLLASAAVNGSYDHYALRKCLNLLLMDFTEVSLTPGFLAIDFDVLVAVVESDEVNAAEEDIFSACMRWVAADESRSQPRPGVEPPCSHLDDLLQHVRFPLMNAKFVAELETHPVASKSRRLQELLFSALKYAVNPRGIGGQGAGVPVAFRQRRGGLYWKSTKNNMCMELGGNHLQTFILNSPCDLVHSWKLKVELFDGGACVLGVAEPTADPHQYIGRFRDGCGLSHTGNFYHGGCLCDTSVRHLCTPVCVAHLQIPDGAIVLVQFDTKTRQLKYTVNGRSFTRCLDDKPKYVGEDGKEVQPEPDEPSNMEQRLHPAVSVRGAKIRIFSADTDIFD